MQIEAFGKALIETGDLDPCYIAIVGADLELDQLYRWLFAYLCFYHVGVASFLSEKEGSTYWDGMLVAAENKTLSPLGGRWPRSAERRHFRGDKCVKVVQHMRERYPAPEDPIGLLDKDNVVGLMDTVQSWPMFGKWVSFKAADIMERCVGANFQIPSDVVLLYDQPLQALEALASDRKSTVDEQWQGLLKYFARFAAPPSGDRECGPAECETVCCKHHGYVKGGYWVGRDIHEVRKNLVGWGDTANSLLVRMPLEVRREGTLF